MISVQYGIPQTCWKASPQLQRRQLEHVADFYACLDLQRLEESVATVLAKYHRNRRYPFVQNNHTRSKFGARQSIQIRACNLLPEIMEIPVPKGGQEVQWSPVRAIDPQHYRGPVYSLGVDTHQHYIADGIVTHNCFYGWREGAAHQYYGPNNATDVWEIRKVTPGNMVHLTEKPVELAARAIEYSSQAGENVLDLFGGSGSTLIACEKLGRKAYLMEIDGLYCDVIVTRWEQFTGKTAIRERAN